MQTFLPYADFEASARALDVRRLGKQRVECEAGRNDTCRDTIAADLDAAGVSTVRDQAALAVEGLLPPWLGDEEFHLRHRSNLVRKDRAHDRPLWPDVPDDLAYVYPPPPTGGSDGRTPSPVR